MKKENMLKIESYFEFFLILFLISVFLFLIKDFLISLLFASSVVFLIYGIYQRLVKVTKNETVSAFFLLIIILFVILLPIYVILVSVISQTTDLIYSSQNAIEGIDLSFCGMEICRVLEENMQSLDSFVGFLVKKVDLYLSSSAYSIFDSISTFLLNLFVFILAFFYLLKDGDHFLKYVKRIIPMKNEYKNALFLRFRDVTSAVFIDTILVAVIQGILVSIGFWLFDIESPIFWGVIASFFALVPMIGTAFIWAPAVVYLFFKQELLSAFLLLVYSVVIISFSDNLLRPFLLKKKIEVHPFLILLSILGGIQFFGFFGIFLGPIVISLLITVLQLYNLDFK